jgi:predicted PurR-regulated permease PerM
VLGTAVGVSLSLAGMPNPVMWGVFAALVNYVPYFGPVAGIIVVAGAGLLVFDTVTHGLLPAGTYLLCHLLEADAMTPWLLGRRFRMNAFVIFVMLMFCAWLWGFLGALLAMPLLVSIKVVCGHVPSLERLGEFLSA